MNERQPAQSAPSRTWALLGLAVCETAARLHGLSLVLLLLSFAAVLALQGDLSLILFSFGLGLAIGQAWYACRLAFDRPLFAAWAQLPQDECVQAQHDCSAALRILTKKEIPAGRAMPERVMGTRALLVRQAIAVLGQALVFVALLIILSRR
jgi:hypothetical protein